MTSVVERFAVLLQFVMPSLAFGLGVLPLFIATGAGSGAQQAIGTGVIGGMLAGTFLGIFFIPVFFLLVMRLSTRLRGRPPIVPKADAEGASGDQSNA